MTPRRSTFSLKCLVCLGLIRCAAMSTTKSGPTLSCVSDLSHENMSCDQSVLHCCMKCNAPNVQIFVFIHLTTVNMGNCPLSAASCASNPADCDNYKVDIGGQFELASIEHGVSCGVTDEYTTSPYCPDSNSTEMGSYIFEMPGLFPSRLLSRCPACGWTSN